MDKTKRVIKSFQKGFIPLIIAGTKVCTIRKHGKRTARAGDTLEFRHWDALPYRSKVRIFGSAKVTRVFTVKITGGGLITGETIGDLDEFAIKDGFDSWNTMRAWFFSYHGLPFDGIATMWENFQINPEYSEDK